MTPVIHATYRRHVHEGDRLVQKINQNTVCEKPKQAISVEQKGFRKKSQRMNKTLSRIERILSAQLDQRHSFP